MKKKKFFRDGSHSLVKEMRRYTQKDSFFIKFVNVKCNSDFSLVREKNLENML